MSDNEHGGPERSAQGSRRLPADRGPLQEETSAALLGSMGGRRYGPGQEARAETLREDTGLLGSMGGVSYQSAPSGADAPKDGELAGHMGSVDYGTPPPEPPAAPEPPREPPARKRDKGMLAALSVVVLTLAATVLLVFLSSLSDGADLYSRGLEGFVNYYKPVEEEEVLQEDGVRYVGDQMVIVSAMDRSYEEMEQFFAGKQMEIVGYVELIDTYQLQLDRSYTLAELRSLAQELERDPHVDSAAVNAVRENTGFIAPNDPWDGASDWSKPDSYAGNWGVVAIRAPQSWERWEPQEVRAGILDNMFDENNSDLNFRMTRDNEVFGWFSDPDESAHGTHVAGTIGAIHGNGVGVAGVAENCVLYGYSAYLYSGTIDEVSAIAELAAQDVRVINYSMGLVPELRDEAIARNGMERDIYYRYAASFSQTAMRHLLRKGYDFVLVCSAGNDPVDALWASEYAYITDPEIRGRILVVGAAGVKRDGSFYQASWSAVGQRVDVLAPGVDILSTVPGGCAYLSGTSMAAPHVTGVCASVWALAPELSGAQVKQIVVRTATTPVPGGDAGLVNMYAAMAAAEKER